jgi:hypothetical protein
MSKFKFTMALLHRRGGLINGPSPGEKGAFDSLNTNYTSTDMIDQFVYAVASAVRLFYQPLIDAQKSTGVASDGTSRANVSHHSIVYKMFNIPLHIARRPPASPKHLGCVIILYAATHAMQRDNAKGVFASINIRLCDPVL